MKSKSPRVQERIQDEKMGREDLEQEPSSEQEPMQHDPDQTEKEDDKASTGGMSSLDFNFLGDFENGTYTLEATTEPADAETSTLESLSAFMEMNRSLPESTSRRNSKNTEKKLLMELLKRRRIEGTARVPFLGTWAKKSRKFIIEATRIGRDAI